MIIDDALSRSYDNDGCGSEHNNRSSDLPILNHDFKSNNHLSIYISVFKGQG